MLFFFLLPFLETTPKCRPAYPTATSGPTKPNQEPAPSFPPAQFVDPTPRPTFVTGPSFAPFQPTPEFVPSSFTQPPIPRPSYAPVDAFQPQTAVPIADSVAAPQFVPGASITMEDLIFGESPPTSSRTDPNAPLPTPAILKYASANVERPTVLDVRLPQRTIPPPPPQSIDVFVVPDPIPAPEPEPAPTDAPKEPDPTNAPTKDVTTVTVPASSDNGTLDVPVNVSDLSDSFKCYSCQFTGKLCAVPFTECTDSSTSCSEDYTGNLSSAECTAAATSTSDDGSGDTTTTTDTDAATDAAQKAEDAATGAQQGTVDAATDAGQKAVDAATGAQQGTVDAATGAANNAAAAATGAAQTGADAATGAAAAATEGGGNAAAAATGAAQKQVEAATGSGRERRRLR